MFCLRVDFKFALSDNNVFSGTFVRLIMVALIIPALRILPLFEALFVMRISGNYIN